MRLRFVLLCSPVWARPEESRRGLPCSCFRAPPLCKLPRGHLPGRTPARDPQSQSTTRGIAGSRDIHTLESPESGSLEIRATHTSLDVRGMWRGPCSCVFTTSQLLSLVSGWTWPFALPRRFLEEIHGTLCSLRSAGPSADRCIYWLRARQPVVKRGQR